MTDEEKKEKKRAYNREYYAKNRDALAVYTKSYREKNREAVSARDKAYYEKNREKRAAQKKAWVKKNREAVAAYMKARSASPEVQRKLFLSSLRRKYGLTERAYDDMVLASCGRCAACGRPDDGTRALGLVVDHCHETRRVRGLLCHNCNTAVGQLGESPDRAMAVFDYLKLECCLEAD